MTWNSNAFAQDQNKLWEELYKVVSQAGGLNTDHPKFDEATQAQINSALTKIMKHARDAGKEAGIVALEGAAYAFGLKEVVMVSAGVLEAGKDLHAHVVGRNNQPPPGGNPFSILAKLATTAGAGALRSTIISTAVFSALGALTVGDASASEVVKHISEIHDVNQLEHAFQALAMAGVAGLGAHKVLHMIEHGMKHTGKYFNENIKGLAEQGGRVMAATNDFASRQALKGAEFADGLLAEMLQDTGLMATANGLPVDMDANERMKYEAGLRAAQSGVGPNIDVAKDQRNAAIEAEIAYARDMLQMIESGQAGDIDPAEHARILRISQISASPIGRKLTVEQLADFDLGDSNAPATGAAAGQTQTQTVKRRPLAGFGAMAGA